MKEIQNLKTRSLNDDCEKRDTVKNKIKKRVKTC